MSEPDPAIVARLATMDYVRSAGRLWYSKTWRLSFSRMCGNKPQGKASWSLCSDPHLLFCVDATLCCPDLTDAELSVLLDQIECGELDTVKVAKLMEKLKERAV